MKGFIVTPRTAPPKKCRRTPFTVADANRALPLVRRIVEDLVSQYRELQRLHKRRRIVRAPDSAAAEALDRKAAESAARLNELIDEAHAIGCLLKDWDSGIVDFPALRDGREVYLCWKLGEDSISHWHEKQAGAAGRQPVDAMLERRASMSDAV